MSSSSLLSDRRSILAEKQLALASTLRGLKDELFSGRLVAIDDQQVQWTFYFYFGRILYADGGTHPVRQWLALLLHHTDTPQRQQILRSLKSPVHKDCVQCWEYEILHASLKQETISRQQLTDLSQVAVSWAIFDIWQSGKFQTQTIAEDATLPTTVLIDPDQVLEAAEAEWLSWQEASLLSCRPNSSIKVVDPDKLQAQSPPTVYQSMMALLDGKSTVREMVSKLKKDIKPFVRTLMPLFAEGILAWSEIPDLPCPVRIEAPQTPSQPQARKRTHTIACIDDSRAICEYMKILATEAGFNFVSVTDPLQTIDTLTDCNPNLIFLDLVMPNTSGYEVCNQLRRDDRFKNIPIVILTGNDGIIDRVRARMSGASDFFGKPLSASKFDTIVKTYLLEENNV